jgi:NADP-dependent 3-hydroxy acid dehydrogenase YdfG
MKDFQDKVAVITGAASGIGRAIAEYCAQEGMKIVISDVDETALHGCEEDLKSMGAPVSALITDVSKSGDIEKLARKTIDTYGAVHLLFNNAGVIVEGRIWENTIKDWEWVLGVNLWGVINGIRVFVPLMLAQNEECHVINTSSMGGLYSDSGLGIYKVTKHGVVTLSETLYHDLKSIKAKLRVSVLCPGFVNTGLGDSDRHRGKEFQNQEEVRPEVKQKMDFLRKSGKQGLSADEVAKITFEAIRENIFYIFPHPELISAVKNRMDDILLSRNPTNPWKKI